MTGPQPNRCTSICRENFLDWLGCNHASSACSLKVSVRCFATAWVIQNTHVTTTIGPAHEDMKKNKQPVQQIHKDAVAIFMEEGKKAHDQANAATLALINTSPDLPPSTYRPFRWTCARCLAGGWSWNDVNSADLSLMTKAIIATQPHCACRMQTAFWASMEKPAKCSGALINSIKKKFYTVTGLYS